MPFSVGSHRFFPLQIQPKAPTSKSSTKHKFVIDFSRPADDGVFDGAAFEKFLHDRVKVDGKPGQLGESVKIAREGTFGCLYFNKPVLTEICTFTGNKITVSANVPFSKRYLKYLTKKYLKKNQLRDWIRYALVSSNVSLIVYSRFLSVIASSKDSYQLRFYNIAGADEEEDEE